MYQAYKYMLDNELESYLKHMHLDEKMTFKEISDRLGCSRSTTSRLCKKFNIPVSNNKKYFDHTKYGYSKEESLIFDLIKWHYNGDTHGEIANKLKCSRITILQLFKRFNINTRKTNLLHVMCGFKSDDDMAQAVIRMYHDLNMSKKQIANYFKVSIDPITWMFKRYRIVSRSSSEVLELEYEKNDMIPTNDEMEIINGMLLGDGHIEIKKYTAILCYTCKHEEIAISAAKLMKRFGGKSYKKTYRSGKTERTGYRMNTKSYPFFKKLRSIWTSKEGRPADLNKSPPSDIQLTSETCYWWYIGDGYTTNGSIRLCTHGFSKSDVEMLASKLPCESTVWESYNKRQNKKYPIITINKIKERKNFLNFIGPCKHECFKYKWRILNHNGIDILNSI